MALMPLGGLLSGGTFETWLPGEGYRPDIRVFLDDQTGLVRGFGPAPEDRAMATVPTTTLIFSVWSCGGLPENLRFARDGAGFAIRGGSECWFANSYPAAVLLWSAIDPTSVRIEGARF
jgi:hypothetical protein